MFNKSDNKEHEKNIDSNKTSKSQPSFNNNFKCKRCNINHKRNECPAYKKKCNNCGRPNHFAIVCKTKGVKFIKSANNDAGKAKCYSIKKVTNIEKSQFTFCARGFNSEQKCLLQKY